MLRLALAAAVLLIATPSARAQDEPTVGVSTGGATSEEPAADDRPADGAAEGPDTTTDGATPDAAAEDAAAEDAAVEDDVVEDAVDHDAAELPSLDEATSADIAAEDAADDGEMDALEEAARDAGVAPEAPTEAPPRWTDERVAAWTTFTVSFGVAVLGGILLAAGTDDINAIENAPDGTEWDHVSGARSRAPLLTGFGAAIVGLGAAAMAVGAGLVAHFGAGGTWVTVSALPGGASVRARF